MYYAHQKQNLTTQRQPQHIPQTEQLSAIESNLQNNSIHTSSPTQTPWNDTYYTPLSATADIVGSHLLY